MYKLQFLAADGWSGQDEEEFIYSLAELCNEHRREGRALLFAFLLYRYKDADLQKVLSDRDYWAALDHRAGRYISVFVINALRDINDPHERWRPRPIIGRQEDGAVARRAFRRTRAHPYSMSVPLSGSSDGYR